MPSPRTRAERLALPLLVLGMLASLPWLVHPFFDAVNDAALYILCAKSLLAGQGYSYLGEPFVVRPPGMSALIAPVIAVAGTNFWTLNFFVSLWGVLAVALLFVWARPTLGTWTAFALGIFVWLNPGWREMCNQTMSDVPGIALLLACLLLERRARSIRDDVLLGVVIGLSSYVRSASILLVPAILLQRSMRGLTVGREGLSWPRFALRRLSIPLLVPLAVLAPWKVRDALHHPEAPVDQSSLYDYASGMWNRDRGDPSSERVPLVEVLARAKERVPETLSVLGTNMGSASRAWLPVAAGGIALLLAAGFLLSRHRVEGGYLLASCALIFVYFSFRERLVLPLWILSVAALAEIALLLLRRFLGASAPLAVVACLALALVPNFDLRPHWDEIRRNDELYRSLAAGIDAHVPRDLRVAVPIASWQYAVYLDRPVWTLFFGWQRAGGMQGVEATLRAHGIDCVALTPYQEPDQRMRPWFEQRYPSREAYGDLLLVSVRD